MSPANLPRRQEDPTGVNVLALHGSCDEYYNNIYFYGANSTIQSSNAPHIYDKFKSNQIVVSFFAERGKPENPEIHLMN